MKQLNLETLREYAVICIEKDFDNETSWSFLKQDYKERYNTTIPECGLKSTFIEIINKAK